ncbi:MAG: PP2C family protein-serine/threonine phosphatase [Bryobacteraceae bacterium]
MSTERLGTPSILIVDDDNLALESLRVLFTLETDYRLTCVNHPHRALEEFARQPLDVVISDYLMPQMNGLELLRELRRLQPESTRILLTGFADKENVIRAVNEVGLYQYLEKPWDNEALLLAVRNAIRERSLRGQVADKVRELDDLLRAHKQLSQRHSDLEREIEMASRVQRSLLPSHPLTVPGIRVDTVYRPCNTLGGDFFDFAQDGPRAGVLVADVSGHGAQAALTSMLLKAGFHEAFARTDAPDEILARMNEMLHRFLPSAMYVAATVLLFDSPLRIRAANGGLPYPFVVRRAKRRVDQAPLQGFPLGLFPDAGPQPWDVHAITLDVEDVLLIASDGLGEIRSPAGEFFQDGHLIRWLAEWTAAPNAGLVEMLLAQALGFAGGNAPGDDITLVAVAHCGGAWQ